MSDEALTVTPDAALGAVLGDIDKLRDFPIDTLERLWAMKRQSDADEARREYEAAFGRVQERIKPVVKDREGDRGSRFATAEKICKMLDPILRDEGFSWSFSDHDSPVAGCVRVSMLLRCAGHSELHHYDAPAWDGSGPKGRGVMTPLQASGAVRTYACRRLRGSVFGIQLLDREDDNDGATPASMQPITAEQARDLRSALEETGTPEARFLAVYGVGSVEELPACNLRAAHTMLAAKRAGATK